MPRVVKPLVIANWKMNLSLRESVSLARALARQYAAHKLKAQLELVLAPTFPALPAVGTALRRSGIQLGAQDVFWKASGAFTGEVSPQLLAELGVHYVIVGHSERRQYLKETDAMVQQKLLAALAHGLTPVLCVGETLSERQVGNMQAVVERQITSALRGAALAPTTQVVVAYEPVWVIGSGQAVAPDEAARTADFIRSCLRRIFTPSAVCQVRVIYGGSVDPTNIRAFVRRGSLEGALVGGASLEVKRFVSLLRQV